jgi:predicted choloylglycine hydrolase
MKFFRKLITQRKLLVFLAIGMLLRSSIAVGYMLDTSPENGELFSIILCDGPAGINAVPGIDKHKDHHSDHHVGHDNGEHEHAAQDHPISSCSFWSASSLSLIANSTFLDSVSYFLSEEIIIYESHLKLRLSNYSRTARAPPTLV